jgi:hypothetical protein
MKLSTVGHSSCSFTLFVTSECYSFVLSNNNLLVEMLLLKVGVISVVVRITTTECRCSDLLLWRTLKHGLVSVERETAVTQKRQKQHEC